MTTIWEKIEFPTDDGYWGRECILCKRYFKIHIEDLSDRLFCTYCGDQFDNDELNTVTQSEAFQKVVPKIALAHAQKELDKMFKRVARGSKYLTYKSGSKIRVRPPTKHLEQDVDSKIVCSNCSTRFQVFGIFGFCPRCRDENILIYEDNFSIIENEILNSSNPKRYLRHGYNDLVSTFENFGNQYGSRYNLPDNVNFQNVKNSKKAFKKVGIDIFRTLSDAEKLTIRRCFSKRHMQHKKGIATQKYINEIPEDSELLGEPLDYSIEELKEGVQAVRKMIEEIIAKTA